MNLLIYDVHFHYIQYIEFIIFNDAYFLVSSSGYCCGAVPNHSRSSLRSSCGAAAKLLRSRCDVVVKLSRSRLRSSGDAGTKPSRKRHEATARLLRNRSNVIAVRCRCEVVARTFKMLRSHCGAITRLRNCSDAVAMLLRSRYEAVETLVEKP